MPKQEGRDYGMHDPDMLAQGQVFKEQLVENLTDFTTKYPGLGVPFADDMQDDIDLCYATISDKAYLSFQHLKTVIVNEKVKEAKLNYMTVFSYLEQAYPKNEGMFHAYGHNLYPKMKNSHNDFPVLLFQAFEMASEPATKALLMAKGATAAQIARLETDGKAILTAVSVQSRFKGSRHLSTQDRIINLNKVWARMVLISDSSKQVYINDYAKRKLFLLYPELTPPTPDPIPPVNPLPEDL